jgi:toxin ParE1/3/4
MKLRLHPEADAELHAAAQWYEDRVIGLGEQFLVEAIDAFTDIENHPQRFGRAKYRTAREIRRRVLDHFPYSVVYEVRKEECIAVAIAHAARRPGFWVNRLK